jgi:SAM-dependent methyltransferase
VTVTPREPAVPERRPRPSSRVLLDWVARAADERTRMQRSRFAEAIFLGRPHRSLDRAMAATYFSLFSWVWANLAGDAVHLQPFGAALSALDALGELNGRPAPRLVVDVGTGAGRSAVMLADRFPAARVEGVDISRRMLREASRTERSNLAFRRGDVRRLPYPAASVDLLSCVNSVVSPAEAHRVLTDGGLLIAASTWFPPRDDSSVWIRRFRECGFALLDRGGSRESSWEIWRSDT